MIFILAFNILVGYVKETFMIVILLSRNTGFMPLSERLLMTGTLLMILKISTAAVLAVVTASM